MPEAEFRPTEILRVLDRHGVTYVLIGGLAAVLHGSPVVTHDVDICPEPSGDNLHRLAAALEEMNARIRTSNEPEGVAFGRDAAALSRAAIWNLVTDLGNLDISFQPSGTEGYEDLVRDAIQMDLGDMRVVTASLIDIVRSKEAAGRLKDRGVLPLLREMLDRFGERSQ
jgi:hypothetical protein